MVQCSTILDSFNAALIFKLSELIFKGMQMFIIVNIGQCYSVSLNDNWFQKVCDRHRKLKQ